MRKILGFYIAVILMISIIPAGIAQEDDLFIKQTTCEEWFCDLIKWCNPADIPYPYKSYEECYQDQVEKFEDCVRGSNLGVLGTHPCGKARLSCEEECYQKYGDTSSLEIIYKNKEVFFNCNNECYIAFDSCAASAQVPTCTGEPEKPTTKPEEEEKECKQISEDTAEYDNKFYTPKCKDRVILLTYVCKDSKSSPEKMEVDCTTVEYGAGKTYKSCSQGSCSKDKLEITLEELISKLKQIKDDENALYLYVIDNPEIVYLAYKNREALSDIKYRNVETDFEFEIVLKLIYIEKEIDRMKQNAHWWVKGGGNLREYVTKNEVMELWQLKLYSQLQEIVEQQGQIETESGKINEEIKQLEKENEKLEREKFWKEEADIIDKFGYKAGYLLTFQALRDKGYSEIFDNPKTRFHEQVSEASGVLAYLPGTGDGIEIAALPSVLMDERMGAGWKTVHIVCAATPFLNIATLEKISYAVSGYSFATTEPEYK